MANYNNFASPISYFAQFSINGEILKYYIQGTKLPDVATGMINLQRNGYQVSLPGDSYDHGTIPVSFIIDEEFQVYFDLLDLQEKYNSQGTTIDFFEIYIQNNQNVNIAKFVFENVFFINVMGPELRTDIDETEIKIDVELAFGTWNRQKLIGA